MKSQSGPYYTEIEAMAEANKLRRQGYTANIETRMRLVYGGEDGRTVYNVYLFIVVYWK